MSSGTPMFCPHCDDYVFPRYSEFLRPEGVPACPVCETALVQSIFNPTILLGPAMALKLLAAVARIIIKTGALDKLQELAKKSETPLDDLALRLAAALLKEAANL